MSNITNSFLGVNCESGFYSLYEEFVNKRTRAYVIKGGPGTGKSTLMRNIARQAQDLGLDVELLHCSSDPDSLDGVYIRQINTCIVDGTPPHVIEPPLPGAVGRIIDLYQFWDKPQLAKKISVIKEQNAKIQALFGRTYLYLGAAGRLQRDLHSIGGELLDRPKLRGYTERLCAKYIKPQYKTAREEKRFLAAITPAGKVFYPDSLYAGTEKQLVFEDEYGLAGRVLEVLRHRALKNGHRVISGYGPLIPDQLTHLVLPDAGLSLAVSGALHRLEPKPYCRVNMSRFLDTEREAEIKNKLAFLRRSRDEIIREGIELLEQCHLEHDVLEGHYKDAIDFKSMNAYVKKVAEEILNG